MVNHYESKQLEYLKEKNSNAFARYMLLIDFRLDRNAFHKSCLQQSCRNVNETLGSAVMKVKILLTNCTSYLPEHRLLKQVPSPKQVPSHRLMHRLKQDCKVRMDRQETGPRPL